MMMMIIPYMLIFGTLFNKKYSILFLIILFGSLVNITIYQGMYESLK